MLAQDRVLWMQVNDDFVKVAPLVDVLVSHWLRLREGCPRTCWRKIKVKVKLAFSVALEKRRMQFNPLAELKKLRHSWRNPQTNVRFAVSSYQVGSHAQNFLSLVRFGQ